MGGGNLPVVLVVILFLLIYFLEGEREGMFV